MFLAIDPGSSAALALITGPGSVITVSCKDYPTDAYDILGSLKKENVVVGIEEVHAIFNASAKSTFGFGRNYGEWIGILKFLGIPFVNIPIKAWQKLTTNSPDAPKTKGMTATEKRKAKKLHKDTLKMESFRAATAAFPHVRLPNHDVADAVNMARYLQIKYERVGGDVK